MPDSPKGQGMGGQGQGICGHIGSIGGQGHGICGQGIGGHGIIGSS